MIKTLAKSVREYKKPSILTAVFVSLEVVLECLIPFVIARLVNQLKAGCALGTIVQYGIVLIAMAGVSLSRAVLTSRGSAQPVSAVASRTAAQQKIMRVRYLCVRIFITSSFARRL